MRMGTRVAVSEPVLRWAIDRSGKPVDTLHEKFPHLHEWESGENSPTLRQLEGLAKATFTPLGFFFLKAPPEERLPVPYFRTHSDTSPETPSANLVQSVHTMQLRQAWARDYLTDHGRVPLPLVRCAGIDEPPTVVARRLHEVLGLSDGWAGLMNNWSEALRHLQRAIEAVGVLVVVNGVVDNNNHRKLDPREFRGFVLVDEYAPLVFVNGADAKAAQMFTLAHELAHLAFGQSAVFDLRQMQPARDPIEVACNHVAAEFLVPASEFRQLWMHLGNDADRFLGIARRFKVSQLVAARRALDIGLITRDEFLEFYERNVHREAEQKSDGGDFWATQRQRVGRAFGSMVVSAAKEGRLAYSEAYRLTGLYGLTFDHFVTVLASEGGR